MFNFIETLKIYPSEKSFAMEEEDEFRPYKYDSQ